MQDQTEMGRLGSLVGGGARVVAQIRQFDEAQQGGQEEAGHHSRYSPFPSRGLFHRARASLQISTSPRNITAK
jgi:hypothetical protein